MAENNKEFQLPRSQSWAVFRQVERLGIVRKQSDPCARSGRAKAAAAASSSPSESVPIQDAKSYRAAGADQDGVKRLIINSLAEQQRHQQLLQEPSRHSAASLKVHFRSMDDISNDNDFDYNNCTTDCDHLGHSIDCPSAELARRRSHSEATSWSVSGSDVTPQGGPEDDPDEEDVNVVPDGGWGWVIVAASFIVNLIADGATFSFGILYVELLDYFKESRSYTAWIGSLFMSIPLLSGPLASSLTDRYGCRTVTIVGSILAALGFILSSISDSVEVLFLTFGLISGFGLSLCYVAAIVIVAYYFEKRRSLATGLAVCGSGIGTFIFAPMTQYLIAEYGWRGTTLILAGLFLNMSVCGALMRDIEGTTTSSNRRLNGSTKRINRSGSESTMAHNQRSRNCSESERSCPPTPEPTALLDADGGIIKSNLSADGSSAAVEDDSEMTATETQTRMCNSLINLPTFLRHGDKIPHEVLMTLTNNPRLYSIVLDNYPALFDGYIINEEMKGEEGEVNPDQAELKHYEEEENRWQVRNGRKELNASSLEEAATSLLVGEIPLHRRHSHHHWNAAYLKGLKVKKRSLTYRGAMLNLPRYRLRASSCPDIYRNSITTIAREKEGACWDYLEELREVFMDMFDFSYLVDPRFVMFAISNALLYCCYHVPYIFIADWAIVQGHPEEDASFLLSVIGILNTVGVIILGYIGDRSWANGLWIYTGAMVLCGLSTAAVPLFPDSYTWLATCSGLFGLCIAANYALAAVILVDLISLERFVNAYGLLLLFQGVANLVGPPLAGRISDVAGTPTSFYIAGVVIIFSGAILMLLPVMRHVRLRMSPASGSLIEDGQLQPTIKEAAKLGQSSKTISTSMM